MPVELASRVGRDASGLALVAALDAAGIGRDAVRIEAGHATAEYAAVLTPGGELALGIAAMEIFDALTPEALAAEAELFAGAPWVFADCNLPAASLLALARRRVPGAGYRLAVDAVSVAKSDRLPASLDGIDLLFANRDEAAALAAGRGFAGGEPDDCAAALLRTGAGACVVTLGAEGALAASAAGVVQIPAVPARVVDVTGAGDALVAATLRALMGGALLPEAVRRGCRAAAEAVGRDGAVGARTSCGAFAVDGPTDTKP